MADGQDNADETCDADDASSNGQSHSVGEDGESQSPTSSDETCSQTLKKSPSSRSSSGVVYQGPHDWRKRLRPVSNLDHLGNNGAINDRKVTSPGDARDRDDTCNRYLPSDDHSTRLPIHVTSVRRRLHVPRQKSEGRAFGTRQKFRPSVRESDFTRQVVKHQSTCGVLRPQMFSKRSSVIYSQTLSSDTSVVTASDMQRCIAKAQRARLYLLRQTGPNSFLIGGDSPDHKYRVTIGEQKCSCGRGPRCVHLLFVMLRLFQLEENDPRLASKTLKNFEVEMLLRSFDERRLHRVTKAKDTQLMKSDSVTADNVSQPASPAESDDHKMEETASVAAADDEEARCPICLIEMVDGESLTVCVNGCQNRLHHHCIARWFEECRQEYKPLQCPLCQVPWKADSSTSSTSSVSALPTNQRSPSPSNTAQQADVESMPLDPVPVEYQQLADQWLVVLSEEIVTRLFSRSWLVREYGLRMLSRDAVTMLLLGVGEGRTGVHVSAERQENTRLMLECCFNVLTHMLADPVYKVFVAGLRTLRSILLYTPSRDTQQQSRLQSLMTPIVNTLLVKCADPNRRMSQLSIDTLLEMIKGDAGELPVGREIVSPGALGLGGIDYLLQCIVESDEDPVAIQWQGLLGRLYILDQLTQEQAADFRPSSCVGGSAGADVKTEPVDCYHRTFLVLRFVAQHVSFPHAKAAKLAYRVFCQVAALQVAVGGMAIVEQVCHLLDSADTQIQRRIRRKLQSIAGDYTSDNTQTSTELMPSAVVNPVVFFVSARQTPPMEVVHDTSNATVSETASQQLESVVCGTEICHDVQRQEDLRTVEVQLPDKKQFVYESTVVVSKQASMIDCCVQTSPSLLRSNKTMRAASSIDDNSDSEFGTSSRTTEPFGLHASDSTALLDSHGSASGSHGSTSGMTDDLTDFTHMPKSTHEKVSFKKEVALSASDSLEQHEEPCQCKEEVEIEEAQALVAAMERSSLSQDSLPHIPGLTRELSVKTVDIHVQDEITENSEHVYKEDVHWKRGAVLGTGAFSTCYQARDVRTGSLMAVKQISLCRNTDAEQEKVIEAVKQEIDLMAKFNHPNIMRILGATQQDCHFFVFVEWMPGCSVAYLLDKFGAFSEPVITSYTEQVLRGLAYLHNDHTIHRDLKGANLLVDSSGQRVRIADFGAAARLASRMTGAGEFEGQLLGTIAFMAPEVLRGESYGRSCDIWSVGCVVIEMTTTKPPWGAHYVSNHLALIFKIASTTNPPQIPENMSPPLRDLLLRCLEVKPDERPTASELLKLPLFTMSKR